MKYILFISITIFISLFNSANSQIVLEMDSLKPGHQVIQQDIIGVRALDVFGKVHNIGIENKKVYPVALTFIDIGCVI